MLVNLQGLIQDGTPPRPGVTANPHHTIEMPLGTDLNIALTVVNPAGITLAWGQVNDITLTIKKNPPTGPRLVKKGTIRNNQAFFSIAANDLRNFVAGDYTYDIWITRPTGRDAVVPLSVFRLIQNATDIPFPQAPIITVVAGDTTPTAVSFDSAITGWTINLIVQMPTPLTKPVTILNAALGLAQINWSPSDLTVGQWNAFLQITKPGPIMIESTNMTVNVLAVV